MKYLWNNLDTITANLLNHKTKILMFDFDGTLTPIVKTPKEANLPLKTRNLLQLLCRKKGFYVAIISGRKLQDLKDKIGLKNIIYAGNHGLEGEIYGRKFLYPVTKKASKVLETIKKDLEKLASQFNGAFVENKKLTHSLHYRMVKNQQIPLLKLSFNKIIQSYLKDGSVSVVQDKKVLDIRPNVSWDKGHFAKLVIKKIATRTKTSPIAVYIGDDVTDEDVFKSLNQEITVRVGENTKTNAKYSLNSVKEVFKFLEWINTKL